MKIILKDGSKDLTFQDVPVDQFFVYRGCLYQKMSDNVSFIIPNAQRITDNKGTPYVSGSIFKPFDKIQKIIEVERIEF